MKAGILWVTSVLAGTAQGQQIREPAWTSLPGPAQALAAQMGMGAANFHQTLSAMDQRTATRLRDGEFDHLIYYMLQSRSFTSADPIEPAQSALAYAQAGPRAISADVQFRIAAFVRALATPANARQQYFASLLRGAGDLPAIQDQYAHAMRFLYRKEIECRTAAVPQTCIASLYSGRGLSSDTSPQSTDAVRAGLEWLRLNRPDLKFGRVLIIGPGVDFAPRTALREEAEPAVYQPAVLSGLLTQAVIDCADINPRVLLFARKTCAATYEMNIATRSVAGVQPWDLIVATNVLLYLDDAELLLAMQNVRAMLTPSGVFLHNDARFSAKVFGRACGLPAIHFGEVNLDASRIPPLTDRFVLHSPGPPGL